VADIVDYVEGESFDETELRELIDLKLNISDYTAYDDTEVRNLIQGKQTAVAAFPSDSQDLCLMPPLEEGGELRVSTFSPLVHTHVVNEITDLMTLLEDYALKSETSTSSRPDPYEITFSPCLANTNTLLTPTLPIASYTTITFGVSANGKAGMTTIDLKVFTANLNTVTVVGSSNSSGSYVYILNVRCSAVTDTTMTIQIGPLVYNQNAMTGATYGLQYITFS
jgi:hypothetical protein